MAKNEFDDIQIPKFLRQAALKAERKRKKNEEQIVEQKKIDIDISRFRKLREKDTL